MGWFDGLFGGAKDEISLKIKGIERHLKQINKNSGIDPSMVAYANNLVKLYLPALNQVYSACATTIDDKDIHFSLKPKEARFEALCHIENCLIDIEHGAIIKDNLNAVFFECLIDFEQKIDERAVE